MVKNDSPLEIICRLAEMLGVDINQPEYSITTPENVGKIKMHDGSLEISLFPEGEVEIENAAKLGILVTDLTKKRDISAPAGAIYMIQSYISEERARNMTSGVIYLGRDGRVLTESCPM